jgi:predicted ribonuclease YlaK
MIKTIFKKLLSFFRKQKETEVSYVLDTNVLLLDVDSLKKFEKVLLPMSVLEELDGIKMRKDDGELAYRARKVIHAIENGDNIEFFTMDKIGGMPWGWNKDLRDNKIIFTAKKFGAILISNDLNVRIKAKVVGVKSEKYVKNECDISYKGFRVITMTDDELAKWYETSAKVNKWELELNQYLLIKSMTTGDIVDCWVLTKEGFEPVQTKPVTSVALGKLKLLDFYQRCVMHSLQNNPVTMIKGGAGTGKSLLTVSYAMAMIESGKFDKLIVFTNPLATKNSARLGFYPGSKDEKLMDSQIGNMLTSKIGDKEQVLQLIKQGKVVLLPFSDIRGFDTSGMNAIIWITEAQNLDVELMRLAIQRVGDDCKVVIDGDYLAQVDCEAFAGDNNGMRRVSEVFRGQEFYGEVELQEIYRSLWAKRAEQL